MPMFLAAVVLLIIRAGAELSLPSLMSDIVDYGIAQGGIESTVPSRLTPETFDLVYAELPEYLRHELTQGLDNISPELAQTMTHILAQLQADGAPITDNTHAVHLAKEFIRAEYERLGVDMAQHQLNYIFTTGGVMIAITLLAIAVAIGQGFLSSRIATGIARRLRKDIFDRVVSFTNTEYNNFSTASLITRSTNDVNQVQGLLAIAVRIVVFSPIMAVGGVLMVVGTDVSMAWIIALAVGLIVAFITIFIIIATPKFKIMQKLIDKVNLVTREGLTGIMVIRAFTAQTHEAQRFDVVNTDLKRTGLFLARLGALQMPIISLIMNFTTILIVWIGAASVDAGNLAVGSIMAFVQYTMFIVWSFLMMAMIIVMLPRAQVAANRIMEILATPHVVTDPDNPVEIPGQARNDISVEFKQVSFKYPGAEGYALSDISFKAQKGKMTAFVGSTGSGKTSLVNLIPRLYDATEGQVLVNGVDVKTAAQRDVRNVVGYVPQQAVLFSGTIETNIKYAGDNVDDAHMEKAAKVAQAHEFIQEREGGYKGDIARGGTNVSGGQRQRLAIARAIAKNPEIYIFDDSFSALDYKTDANLRAAITQEIGNATMLVVAQRIGTIKNADQIIVLDNGKIVGRGTHRELLKTCDVYKQIASSQLSEQELAKDLEGEVTS